MNKARLLKLADFLETVPRKHFNMAFISNGKKDCGFAGCAVGWAIHGKLFPGLKYNPDSQMTEYRGIIGHEGVDKLFGGKVWFDLFSDDRAGTPHQVSKRIRKFVADAR